VRKKQKSGIILDKHLNEEPIETIRNDLRAGRNQSSGRISDKSAVSRKTKTSNNIVKLPHAIDVCGCSFFSLIPLIFILFLNPESLE